MNGQKRSGWYYVFVGCGVLLLAGIIAVGAGVFMTVRWTKSFKNEMEDPQLRTSRASEAMNIKTMPDGYHVAMNIRAPFGFGNLVMLSDGLPGESAERVAQGDHFFLYMEGPGWDPAWKEFVGGGDPPIDALSDLNIHVDGEEILGRGDLTVDNMEVFYSASAGDISTEGVSHEDGVFSILLVRCPEGDKRSRIIVWSGPPPAEDAADRIRGTTGDPERIGEMLGHFRLCG